MRARALSWRASGGRPAQPVTEEVFRFVTDEIREVGVHLLGRGLYETLLYWETAGQDPSLDDAMLEWAAIWKPLPKVVFSTTLAAEAAALGLIDEYLASPVIAALERSGSSATFTARKRRPSRTCRWIVEDPGPPASSWLARAAGPARRERHFFGARNTERGFANIMDNNPAGSRARGPGPYRGQAR